MLDFILDRYNYWVVIILMMIGLYIVFARGNLVKKIIGLNIFQTSVFIFYISIGKVAGGTAPIFLSGHGDGHGDVYSEGYTDGHGDAGPPSEGSHDLATPFDGGTADIAVNRIDAHEGAAGQTLDEALASHGSGDSVHRVPGALADEVTKNLLDDAGALSGSEASMSLHELAGDLAAREGHDGAAVTEATHGGQLLEAAADAAEVLYSNPLPHVLILTAIVVGVATTAVGLALAVRIREAYGTIEEDELEAADDIAEFGESRYAAINRVRQAEGGAA